jgi:Atypical PilZ domain, cyclic di-GMP receptor
MEDTPDTVVLHNELAYHDVLPVQWQPRERPLTRFELGSLEEANLLLLQAQVALEDHSPGDDSGGALAGEIARLDLKLNLVLQLLAKLVLKERMPPPTTIQFNALGASWTAVGSTPTVGAQGQLRIYLRGSLPQPLDLPAEVTAVEGSTVKFEFVQLPESVAELIQRLAFLRHRRDVAGARKARSAQ